MPQGKDYITRLVWRLTDPRLKIVPQDLWGGLPTCVVDRNSADSIAERQALSGKNMATAWNSEWLILSLVQLALLGEICGHHKYYCAS